MCHCTEQFIIYSNEICISKKLEFIFYYEFSDSISKGGNLRYFDLHPCTLFIFVQVTLGKSILDFEVTNLIEGYQMDYVLPLRYRALVK